MFSALDRDIAWLNARLDEVAPRAALARLEQVRALAAKQLGGSVDAAAFSTMSLEEMQGALKLLTAKFHLRNKAEQVQIMRINRQRERLATPDKPRPESLDEVVGGLARRGVARDQVMACLASLDIQPTLTAHPTEARRRSVVDKQRRIGDVLMALDGSSLTKRETARAERAVRQALAVLLVTDEVRSRRLDVMDEVRNGLHYLAGTIWDAVPGLHRDVRESIEQHYPQQVADVGADRRQGDGCAAFLRYRSWIGGDRDGNPYVTARLTQQALAAMRAAALERHAAALAELGSELSLSSRRVPVDPALLESIERDAAECPLDAALLQHLEHEPIRVKIRYMQARLGQDNYGIERFVDDLSTLQAAVRSAGLHEVANRGLLDDALLRARSFGFHLAALDVRQHSSVHEAAVSEMLAHAGVSPNYARLAEADRRRVLGRELKSTRPLLAPGCQPSAATRELLDTLAVLARAAKSDPASLGSYIVSMAHHPSDLLEVLVLFREVGLWSISEGAATCPLDIVPLFETVEDLANAGDVLRDLFADPAYAAQLAARGEFQEVMLGYSDSNKDGGYWAANWGLYQTQGAVARACREAGVSFRFFHGRGGTVARGGGRAHRAILASLRSSANGRIRFTEQGEVISFRYAAPALAHRHLEQIVNAMIQATLRAEDQTDQADEIAEVMDELAERSKLAYGSLVQDQQFWSWFVESSPVLHIGELPIASRPVLRAGRAVVLDNLRAIPWVFAWTQMRYNAPGWYGIGTAFEDVVMPHPSRVEQFRAAYQAGGYVRAFIDNAQQEMARARLPVGRWYAEGQGATFHQLLSEEFARAERAILAITGQGALLDNNPVIQQSIRERNPDSDAINALQVELLRRWRLSPQDERGPIRAAILLSVNALAAAMQSTG